MPDDKLKGLYDKIIGTGKVTPDQIGDYQTWSNLIAEPSMANKFYSNLIKNGVATENEIGDFDTFYSFVTTNLKPIEPPKLSQTIDFDKAIGEIDAKIQDIDEELMPAQPWQETLGDPSGSMEMLRQATGAAPKPEAPPDYQPTTSDDLDKARYNLQTARDLVRKAQLYSRDSKTYAGDFIKGFTSPLAKDFLSMGIAEMVREFDVLNVAKQAQRGESLTDEEQTVLEAYGLMNSVLKEEKNVPFSVGRGLSKMVPYIAQFAATGGAGAAVRGGVKALMGMGLKTLTEATGKAGIRKYATKEALKRLIPYTAGAAVQTTLMPGTYTETASRMIGEVGPDGEITAYDKLPEALYKGYATMFSEVFTENMGGYLRDAAGSMFKGVANRALQSKVLPRTLTQLERFRKQAAIGNFFEEYSEEVVNGLMQPIVAEGKLPTIDPKEQLITALTVAGMTGSFYMGGKASRTYSEVQLRKELLSDVDPDVKSAVIGAIKERPVQDLAADLDRIIKNPNLTDDQRRNVLNYALHSVAMRTNDEFRTAAGREIGTRQVEGEVRGQMAPFTFKDGETMFQVLDQSGNIFWVKDGQINVNPQDNSYTLGQQPLIVVPMEGGEPKMIPPSDVMSVRATSLTDQVRRAQEQFQAQYDLTRKAQGVQDVVETEVEDSRTPDLKTGDQITYNGREAVVNSVSPDAVEFTYVDNDQPGAVGPDNFANIQKVTAQPQMQQTAREAENKRVLTAMVDKKEVKMPFTALSNGTFQSDATYALQNDANKVVKALSNKYSNSEFEAVNMADPNDPFSENSFVVIAKPKKKQDEIIPEQVQTPQQVGGIIPKGVQQTIAETQQPPQPEVEKPVIQQPHDTQDQRGIQGGVQEGQEPIQTQPIQETGGKEIAGGGILQAQEKVLEEKSETPYDTFTDELGLNEPFDAIPGNARTGKIGEADVVVYQKDKGNITIESIRVPKERRRRGEARRAMQSIVDAADKHGLTLKLRAVPEEDSEMSHHQLRDFYREFNFSFIGPYGVRFPAKKENAESKPISEIPQEEGKIETSAQVPEGRPLAQTESQERKIQQEPQQELNNGDVITNLYKEWVDIKDEQQHTAWAEKVKGTRFGTYKNQDILNVIDNFDIPFKSNYDKQQFITEVEEALNIPLEERTYKPKEVTITPEPISGQSEKPTSQNPPTVKDSLTTEKHKETFAGDVLNPKVEPQQEEIPPEPGPENMDDWIDWVSRYSTDPDQVKIAWQYEIEHNIPYNNLKDWQVKMLGITVSPKSWNNLADKNWITKTFAKRWLRKSGKPIDQIIHDDLNTEDYTVETEDVIQFMRDVVEKRGILRKTTDTQIDLERRYRDLTGKSLKSSLKPKGSKDIHELLKQEIARFAEEISGEKSDDEKIRRILQDWTIPELRTVDDLIAARDYFNGYPYTPEEYDLVYNYLTEKENENQVNTDEGEVTTPDDLQLSEESPGVGQAEEEESEDPTERKREITHIRDDYQKQIDDLKQTLVTSDQIKDRVRKEIAKANRKVSLFGTPGEEGEQDMFVGDLMDQRANAKDIEARVQKEAEAENKRINDQIEQLRRDRDAEIRLAEKQVESKIPGMDAVSEMVHKYGWSADVENGDIVLSNRKGKKVVTVKKTGGTYAFYDNSGAKLMSGNANLPNAIETLLTGYYFAKPIDSNILFQLQPEVVKQLNYKMKLPTSEEFKGAVENTTGAKITKDGLLIDLVRYQKEEQGGDRSVRTGVFYLPVGSPQEKYYRGSKTDYGGTEKITGTTLIRRPIFVKGGTGGKAPENAYDQIKGKNAYQEMRSTVLNVINVWNKRVQPEDVAQLLTDYNKGTDYDDNYDIAYDIVRVSTKGNTLAYAIQENIVAHAVREAGYDSIIGFSKKRDGSPFISEIFDVREISYPMANEESDIHERFLNNMRFQLQPSTDNPLFSKDEGFAGDIIFGKKYQDFLRFHENLTTMAQRVSEQTGTKIIVVKSSGELPRNLRDAVVRMNKQGKFSPALFYEKSAGVMEVYLISNQSKNTEEAAKSLLHEVVGHNGLRMLFGQKYTNLLRQVWAQMPESEKRRIAGLYKTADRDLIADEWLASKAETLGEDTPSFVRRVISQVRQWLRDLFGLNLKFTDKDLAALFRDSRRVMKKRMSVRATDDIFAGDVLRQSLTLYHGTPHDFDKFSTDKIGTGEGAQAYGWGLYFTELKDVAEYYANKLAFNEAITNNYGLIINGQFANTYRSGNYMVDQALFKIHTQQTKADAIKALKEITYNPSLSKEELLEAQKAVDDAIKIIEDAEISYKPAKVVITAMIHKGKSPDQYDYLRWDKPVTDEQQTKIYKQARLEKIPFTAEDWKPNQYMFKDGEKLYDKLAYQVFSTPREASLFLLRAGIDGIKYPAEGRGDNARGFNYVVFDEDAIEIEDKLKFQIIGEQGAQRLFKAGLAVDSINNLAIAKKMEAAGKSEREIWLTTGWQRGKEGKWRMEIEDFKLIDNFKQKDGYWNDGEYEKFTNKVGEIIDPKSNVLSAYPSLKNIKVDIVVSPSPRTHEEGSFIPAQKNNKINVKHSLIFITAKNWENAKSMLAHEIQHAIQYEEGFVKGGNPNMFHISPEDRYLINNIRAAIRVMEFEGKDASDKTIISMSGGDNVDPNVVKKLIKEKSLQELYEINIRESAKTPIEQYKRLAGEVEARNVQTRLTFDDLKRAETMLSESEDVDRKDQMVLMESMQNAMDLIDETNPDIRFQLREDLENSYPRKTVGEFNIRADGDVVTGDHVEFERDKWGGSYRKPTWLGKETIRAIVINDSYGAKKQQHTFTLETYDGKRTTIKGRNLYKYGVMRKEWMDEAARQIVADEKHERGYQARKAREMRRSGMTDLGYYDAGNRIRFQLYISEVNTAYGSAEEKEKSINKLVQEVNEKYKSTTPTGNKAIKPRTVIDTFQEQGYVDFTGVNVKSPQDIAELWSIHRSPYIEKSHLIFLRDGKIVGTSAYTLNQSAETKFPASMEIRELAKGFNANEFYMVHNHPSGNHKASLADIYITGEIVHDLINGEEIDKYKVKLIGHVIINHEKYTFINPDKAFEYYKYFSDSVGFRNVANEMISDYSDSLEYKNAKPRLFTERESIAGDRAQDRMMEIGKALLTDNGYNAAIIYLTPNLQIAAYDIVPTGMDLDSAVTYAMERRNAEKLGHNIIIVHDGLYESKMRTSTTVPSYVLDIINTKTQTSHALNQVKMGNADFKRLWEPVYRYDQNIRFQLQESVELPEDKEDFINYINDRFGWKYQIGNNGRIYQDFMGDKMYTTESELRARVKNMEKQSIVSENSRMVIQYLKDNGFTLIGNNNEAGSVYYQKPGIGIIRVSDHEQLSDKYPTPAINAYSEERGGYEELIRLIKELDNANIRFQLQPPPPDIAEPNPEEPLQANPMLKNRADYARELVQDKMLTVRRWEEEVIKRGGIIDENSQPYREENLSQSKSKVEMEKFDEKFFAPLEATINEVITKTGLTYEDVVKYLKAKHARERNKVVGEGKRVAAGSIDGNLLTDAVADWYTDQFENEVQKYDLNLTKKLNDAVHKATRFTLNRWLNDGFISREAYEKMIADYEYYVPLRGWAGEQADAIFDYQDSDIGSAFNPFRSAKGRKSESDDPIPYILSMAYSAIVAGNKNQVKRQALNLAKNNREMTDLHGFNKLYIIEDEEGNVIEETVEKPDNDKLPVGYKVVTKYSKPHMVKRTKFTAKQHEVEVWQNGERIILHFPGDPKIAQAINGQNIWMEPVSRAAQATVGRVNRYLSAVLTSKNPAFIPVNWIRDVSYASMAHMIQSEGDVKTFMRNIPVAAKAIHRHLRGEAAINPTQVDKMYDDFRSMGGETGYVHLKDIEKIRTDVQRELARLQGASTRMDKIATAKVVQAVGKTINYLAIESENMARFATYLTSLEQGKSKKQAASDAKNITVNFNRKGRMSTLLGSLYVFFNANIQGLQNFAKLAKDNKKAFVKAAVAWAALGMLSSELARLWSPPDDDGERAYDNLNEFLRRNYLILPNPAWLWGKGKDKFITIPLPHGFRAVFALGVIAGEIADGRTNPFKGVLDVGFNAFDAFAPLNFNVNNITEDGITWTNVTRPFVPSSITPIVDVAINKDFAGNLIFREPFTKDLKSWLPNSELGMPYVNDVIYQATAWLNRLGGGDEYRSARWVIDKDGKTVNESAIRGLLDINPSVVEHLIEGYTGGVGTELNNLVKLISDSVQKAMGDPETEIYTRNIPVLRRLYRTASAGDPWKEYVEIKNHVRTYNHFVTLYRNERVAETFQNLYGNAEMRVLDRLIERTDKRIERIERAIEANPGSSTIKQYYDSIDEVLKDFLKQAAELKQKEE